MNRLVAAGLHIRSCDLQGAIKMPLVILCGAPKSGKSAFAEILNSFLLPKKPTEIVQEERLNDEKKSRSALLACVERSLSRENFVIVDSTNHIKGFRYQLFALLALLTPHAVIFLSGTLAGEDWSEMEIPNNQNRWIILYFLFQLVAATRTDFRSFPIYFQLWKKSLQRNHR